MLYKRVVASLAAMAFALSAKLAARVVIPIGSLLRWRESCARAQLRAFTAFWLGRIAGALYAMLPKSDPTPQSSRGWYGRGRRFGFARHGLSLNCFASVLLFGFEF